MNQYSAQTPTPAPGGGCRSMVRGAVRYGIPLLVSAGLCYVLMSQVDLKENMRIVHGYCNMWWIGLSLLLSFVSMIIRAARWGIQLRALHIRVPFHALCLSIFGTYAVNLVLPRLGEIWRCGYIARRQRARFSQVFGSMVADRVADTLTVALIMLLTALLASSTLVAYVESEPQRLANVQALLSNSWFWTAAGILLIGSWLLFTRIRSTRLAGRIRSLWSNLWGGFIVILHMQGRWEWIFWTVALWTCYYVQLYVAFHSFDFTAQIASAHGGATAVLVCFLLSTIAMILPSNGGIGPWQMAVVYGLSLYSAGVVMPAGQTFRAMSIAFANCVMFTQTLMLIGVGILTFVAIAVEKRKMR